MADQNVFIPHSKKQESIILTEADLTIAGTGTQWGKSQSAALWFKKQIHTFTDKTDNFLILAPTYKIMKQSALPYFLHFMQGMGRYVGSEGEFKLLHGGTVYLRTGTDPESIVGIPKVRAFWLDEAGKATLYFWEQIQARAAAVGARGLLTTSPYSRNWLYKDYIKPKQMGELPEIPVIQAASWENPYHTLHDPKKRAEMEAKMDPRRFAMIFGGEWGQMIGLVYDCFDEVENQIQPFELPPGTRFVAGVDWGFNPDPFVLKVRAITPDGNQYGVSEFCKTKMTITDMVAVAKQKQQIYGIKQFYCDPSQPGYIEEFNRAGIAAIGADNDIMRGVDLHYELLRSRRLKYFRGQNQFTLDEYEVYHYPELVDLEPDQDSKPQVPVDQNNHCMDAERYISISVYRSHLKLAPKVPEEIKKQETREQKLARLMRRRRSGNSESWS